jgi:hypothetical protein
MNVDDRHIMRSWHSCLFGFCSVVEIIEDITPIFTGNDGS